MMTTVVFSLKDHTGVCDQMIKSSKWEKSVKNFIKNLMHFKLSAYLLGPEVSIYDYDAKIIQSYTPSLGNVMFGCAGQLIFGMDLAGAYLTGGGEDGWHGRKFFYTGDQYCTLMVMTEDQIIHYKISGEGKSGDITWSKEIFTDTDILVGAGSGFNEACIRLKNLKSKFTFQKVCRTARYFDKETGQFFNAYKLGEQGHTEVIL